LARQMSVKIMKINNQYTQYRPAEGKFKTEVNNLLDFLTLINIDNNINQEILSQY